MKRLSPLVICAIALCAITIAVAYTRATGPLAGRGAGPRQDPVPQPRVFPLDSYLAAGFPIAMANAVVVSQSVPGEKSDRAATAKVTVVNRAANRIDSVSILLFAFQGAARLTRVDSWIRPVNLSPGASAELAFDLERRVTPGDKLILAVERVNGAGATREVAFLDLALSAAVATTGVKPPEIRVDVAGERLPDDSGASLCGNGYRRAMTLAQQGDRASVTSFTCDQADRSFTFTFSGKALGK